MKKTAQRQPLRTKAPPQKRSRQKVVTINAEIVKLHRHGAGDSGYDEALATEILEQLAEGKTLRAICREPNMPSARREKLSDEQVDAQLLGLLEGSDYAALSSKHQGTQKTPRQTPTPSA